MSRRHIDITPELMLRAYRAGLFPMAESAARRPRSTGWTRSGAASSRSTRLPPAEAAAADRPAGPYRVTADADFAATIAGCAAAAPGREDTWINPQIERLFVALHRQGHAHSVEVWQGEAWSAASMAWCSAAPSSARACSAARGTPPRWRWCTWWRGCGWAASPCSTRQFLTEHLAQFGAHEIPRADYKRRLATAMTTRPTGSATPDPATLEAEIRALRARGPEARHDQPMA